MLKRVMPATNCGQVAAWLVPVLRTYGERMSHYASGAQTGAMVATGPHGRIRLRRDGSARITLSLTAAEVEATALGQELLARIYLAGGAETVAFGLLCETTVCSENDIVPQRRALRDRSNLIFGSAHPQGGNTMSDDPDRGVVDSRFRVHGLTGISVIDASILPTNLFANCQATVMALGWVAADEIMAGHQ